MVIPSISIIFSATEDALDALLKSESLKVHSLREENDRKSREKEIAAVVAAEESLKQLIISAANDRTSIMEEQDSVRHLLEGEFRYAPFVLVPLRKELVSGNLSAYYSATHERARHESMYYSMSGARGEDSVDPETFLQKHKRDTLTHEGNTYLKLSRDRWVPGSNLFEQYVANTYDNHIASSIVKHANNYTVTAYGTPSENVVTIGGLPYLVLGKVELRVTSKWEDLSCYD